MTRLTALATLAGAALLAHAQTTLKPMSLDEGLADLPERWAGIAELFDVPGAAIAIVKDGEAYGWTYGTANPETGAPVTPDTMFYIASITKTYTATGVLKLCDEGRLSLDDTLAKHLPGLELPGGLSPEDVTVEDLISHRMGINAGMTVVLDAYTGEITPERYAHWLPRGTAERATRYTNVNYTLAGRVIEAVTGMSWRDYLAQEVFEPAGMTRTTPFASRLYADPDAAFPTVWDGEGWTIAAQRKTDRTMHAAGGLGTTATDGAAWMLLHLNDGEVNGGRVLNPDTARAMRQLHAPLDEHEGSIRIEHGFGHGWNVGTFADQTPLMMHGGGYVGTATWVGILPEHDAGVYVLVNGEGLARGWADIVAIDALERLSGASAPWSPYERFQQQARELKASGEAPRVSPGLTVLGPDACSRPAGFYTGWFRSELLGTLRVEAAHGGLTLWLGDATLAPEPTDTPDLLRVPDLLDDSTTLRFVVEPDGTVNRVVMTSDGHDETVFRR
ncbi:MAG: serine hydrolase domain-containing protein [Phycisphaerales bacterium JB040]